MKVALLSLLSLIPAAGILSGGSSRRNKLLKLGKREKLGSEDQYTNLANMEMEMDMEWPSVESKYFELVGECPVIPDESAYESKKVWPRNRDYRVNDCMSMCLNQPWCLGISSMFKADGTRQAVCYLFNSTLTSVVAFQDDECNFDDEGSEPSEKVSGSIGTSPGNRISGPAVEPRLYGVYKRLIGGPQGIDMIPPSGPKVPEGLSEYTVLIDDHRGNASDSGTPPFAHGAIVGDACWSTDGFYYTVGTLYKQHVSLQGSYYGQPVDNTQPRYTYIWKRDSNLQVVSRRHYGEYCGTYGCQQMGITCDHEGNVWIGLGNHHYWKTLKINKGNLWDVPLTYDYNAYRNVDKIFPGNVYAGAMYVPHIDKEGNILLVPGGWTSDQVKVVKLNSTGHAQWGFYAGDVFKKGTIDGVTYAGTSHYTKPVTDSQGNILVAGTARSGPFVGLDGTMHCENPAQGLKDDYGWDNFGFIMKISAAGQLMWVRCIGGYVPTYPNKGLAVDSNDDIYWGAGGYTPKGIPDQAKANGYDGGAGTFTSWASGFGAMGKINGQTGQRIWTTVFSIGRYCGPQDFREINDKFVMTFHCHSSGIKYGFSETNFKTIESQASWNYWRIFASVNKDGTPSNYGQFSPQSKLFYTWRQIENPTGYISMVGYIGGMGNQNSDLSWINSTTSPDATFLKDPAFNTEFRKYYYWAASVLHMATP